MIIKEVKIFKKDLKQNTNRPVLKDDSITKKCPCCRGIIENDTLIHMINGFVMHCPNCGQYIQSNI